MYPPPGGQLIQKLIEKYLMGIQLLNALFLYIYFFNIMTFDRQLTSIQAIIKSYSLTVVTDNNINHQTIEGMIDGYLISIGVGYEFQVISWWNKTTGETKTYNF